MAAAAATRRVRVLCLHGKRQTKETFRARLGKLPRQLRETAELVFVDAPHELPLAEGDDVPTRTWWEHADSPAQLADSLQRSFDALAAIWRDQGPFDGVLGFSMGGLMACAMAARSRTDFPSLRFVLVGGSPLGDSVPGLWRENIALDAPLSIPSLHVFGTADRVVDASQSRELAARFADAELFEHEQGHCFPMNRPACDRYIDFITRMQTMVNGDELAAAATASELAAMGDDGANAETDANNVESQAGPTLCETDEAAQEQRDELEALAAIYPDTLEIEEPAPSGAGEPCARFRIQVNTPESGPLKGKPLTLRIALPADYPNSSPHVRLEHSFNVLQFPDVAEQHLNAKIAEELAGQLGMPCAFSAVSTTEAWLEDPDTEALLTRTSPGAANGGAPVGAGEDEGSDADDEDPRAGPRIWQEETEERETEMVQAATAEACALVAEGIRRGKESGVWRAAQARGVRRFTVGLVGKPSAGKSTFFNCVTRLQNEAKVAAHPFTTIEPNFGQGWWSSPDEADTARASEDGAQDGAKYGRDAQGRRLLPLVIKDVAGLIPGAYKGQGKGNRFLNDLCDADVLVHVVDVSGSSDKNGVAVEQGDASASTAAEDIQWVREELHRWIFGNVAAKWQSVVRAARSSERAAEERLLALFSGYQGSKNAVETAVMRATIDISQVHTWSRLDLHRVVAHFLSVRFPMCLALNKSDRCIAAADQDRIAVARQVATEQGYLAVPCSAFVETTLLGLAKAGVTEYDLGAKSFSVLDAAGAARTLEVGAGVWEKRAESYRQVLATLGGTGVIDCISSAVQLRQPVLVYPVSDLRTGVPIEPPNKGKHGAPFRDCLQALPGTTIEDVFLALKRNAVEEFRLEGDFIRAEACAIGEAGAVRQCGKDHVLDAGTRVLKILTNKKPAWQQQLRGTPR